MISRRRVLRGVGRVAVALPWLDVLAPRSARAQARPGPAYIQMFVPQGTRHSAWTPTGSGRDFTLSPILQPLAAHRGDLVVISGVANTVAGLNVGANAHGAAARSVFTCMPFAENLADDGALIESGLTDGQGGGTSFDQLLAARFGDDMPYRSLDCGIGEDSGDYQVSFVGARDPVGQEHDPRAAFDRIFGGNTAEGSSTIARLHAARGSVLDTVLYDFDRVRTRVGAEDRQRLDAHAEKIRELERRLTRLGDAPPGCIVPSVVVPPGYDPLHSDFDDVGLTAFIDLVVMAIACDLTRVATLHFTNAYDPRFPFLGLDLPAGYGSWHTMIHDAPGTADEATVIAAMQWYSAMLAVLLDRLADTPDGEGTLLDRVLVLCISELGDGKLHSFTELPIVLAGRAGGLDTGRHLDAAGHDLGGFYTGVLQRLGFDDETFGFAPASGAPLVL
ncbi:MAG: DUF1552 domain-containing protein [Deltaproteobacteria bacterium]|nr:DUF1552 domain-containing protein [Nannocystaceae bacterium]